MESVVPAESKQVSLSNLSHLRRQRITSADNPITNTSLARVATGCHFYRLSFKQLIQGQLSLSTKQIREEKVVPL